MALSLTDLLRRRGAEAHRETLREAFADEAPEHFAWRAGDGFVAGRERALARAAFLPLGARVLDLGCGDGATLAHVGAPAGAVGVDLFPPKLAFARRQVGARVVAGSATELPFRTGSFDHVIVRDLIHHLPEPGAALAECRRVLAPGGRLDVLEPCRYNPLIFAHAVSQPAERGELRSTLPYLVRLVGARFRVESTARHQGLPIHRILFHPHLGRAELAESPAVASAVAALEGVFDRIMPAWARAYIHVRASAS